jgi:hypothetical protein
MAESLPTSRRVRIVELADIEFGDSPRIDVMGIVVASDNGRPASFVIDDGSGLVLVRRFDDQPAPVISTPLCVIGRLRDSGERYLACEVAKTIDPAWIEVRKLELAKRPANAIPSPAIPAVARAPAMEEEKQVDLLVLIRKLDTGSGALIDDIITEAGAGAEQQLRTMMSRGDIYELSPGCIKILE